MERCYTLPDYPHLRLVEAADSHGTEQGCLDIWTMLREIGPGENGFGNEGYDVPLSRFREHLRRRVEMKLGQGLRPGRVPMTTFWLYAGSKPVAVSKVRHRLNASLRKIGGHIGYCVRPSERGQGYGNRLLALTLVAAGELGIDPALITCTTDNAASRRVVEYNRGKLLRTEAGLCYYWVPTAKGRADAS